MRNFGSQRLPGTVRIVKYMNLQLAGHVAGMGKTWNAYRNLVGKPI
jgi:hypothetical protein